MANPTLERAARAVERCRIEARDKRNLELQKMGLWPDHAAQPSNEEIARAVLMAVRVPDKEIIESAFHDALEPVYPSDFTRVCDAILADGGE